VTLLLGFPEQAHHLFDQALRRSESRNDRFRLGAVHLWRAIFCELLHDAGATLEEAQAPSALAAKEPACDGLADLYTGIALMTQSIWEAGEGYLRNGIKACNSVDLLVFLTCAKLYQAEFQQLRSRSIMRSRWQQMPSPIQMSFFISDLGSFNCAPCC